MTVSNTSALSGGSFHHHARSCTRSLKNIRLGLALLLCFTAGIFFISTFMQVTSSNSLRKHLPMSESVSSHLRMAQSYFSSPAERVQGSFSNDASKDSSFEKSESFRAMVRAKRDGNYSSVEEYLTSVKNYLMAFWSPMIRQTPDLYSWPETEEDKRKRDSNNASNARVQASSSSKLIVWYNTPVYLSPKSSEEWFHHCPVNDCVLSRNYKQDHVKADAVLFLGGPTKLASERDHPKQIFVFFTMESPWLTGGAYGKTVWNSAFNWTWNYRTDSDIFEPVGYLKPSPSIPSHSSLLSIMRHKIRPVVWMSSNCNVQSKRDQYVKRLRKVIPVDIYGRCGDMTCRRDDPKCTAILNQYFFYLSFENSMCVDYVTEKYYKTFNDVHIVPVVRGGANYSRFFPEGTFVDAEQFPSPEALGRYLLSLAEDEARYVDLLWRKAHFVYHEHGIVDAFCQLCYKLHHLDRFAKTYSDMYGWYHRDKCRPPRSFLV